MRVYVTEEKAGTYRVSLRRLEKPGETKELEVPDNAGYLLLAAQATSDALQDSLEAMVNREQSDALRWEHNG